MKLRYLLIFVCGFILTFAVLNSRFVFANFRYWATGKGTLPPQVLISDNQSAQTKKTLNLPNNANLVLESLGISAPIVFNSPSDPKTIYGNLENGVVHYPSSPKPGMDGVSLILGHSSAYPWYKGKYGSVFALLGKLKPGDKIFVEYGGGQNFVFSVKQSIVFTPLQDNEKLSEIESNTKPTIVLISCWPIGTNYKRIAVEAELI